MQASVQISSLRKAWGPKNFSKQGLRMWEGILILKKNPKPTTILTNPLPCPVRIYYVESEYM